MVKAGYKKTEIGLLPTTWDAKPLPELAWFQEGPGLRNWQFTKSGMKVINVTNLENGFLNLDRTDRHISLEEFSKTYRHFEIDPDDIVMASSGNSYSKTAVVRERDLPLMMNTSVIRFKPINECDYNFLLSYLKSDLFKGQIDLLITGGAQPNFGPYHLRKIFLPVPPPKEQQAIAEALADVDGLIAGLEGLIAKKRAVKQATMQQLLTGRKRLPGFEGDGNGRWSTKPLGEIANVTMGQSPSSSFYNTKGIGLPLVQGNADIKNRKTIIRNYTSQITKSCYAGEIILSVRAPVGEVAKTDFDACIGRGVCAISYPNDFLYHYLIFLEPQWGRLSKGSTFDSVNSDEVRALELQLPDSMEEQQAISKVLTDMDTEITALEARRAKTQALKQAMMQELLTGRTRLLSPHSPPL